MRIEVIRAWPRWHESVLVELPEGACVGDALTASGFDTEEVAGVAVFGVNAEMSARLHQGDRVELLRPLLADPKDARRRRANKAKDRP